MTVALLGSGILGAHGQASGLFTGNTFIGDTTYDRIWSLATLYKDENNPILQEFALQGRVQIQTMRLTEGGTSYSMDDLDAGPNDERYLGDHFELRRLRFGFKSKWYQNYKLSLNTDIVQGRFGLVAEMLWANGEPNQSDVFGVAVIPSYFIADGLQLVGRVQYASSDRPNGLTLPNRYEAVIPGDDRGDQYLSGYLGLNYYLYGHKLKLMLGVEYSAMEGSGIVKGTKGGDGDFDGYTALAGVRMFF